MLLAALLAPCAAIAQNVVASPSTLTVAEGSTGTINVRMSSAVGSSVTVTGSATTTLGSSTLSVSPASLTFTSLNGTTDQAVTVSASHDGDTTDGTATVSFTDGSSTATVTVTITDDDTSVSRNPAVTITPSTVTVTEGASTTLSVQLASQNVDTVTVAIPQDRWGFTTYPTELSFAPADWNVAQTLTLTAAHDDDASNDTIAAHYLKRWTHLALYETKHALNVTVTDDDSPAIVVSSASVALNEGTNGTFTTRLATRPTGTVTLTLANADDTAVGAYPVRYTFTRHNWHVPQTVYLRAVSDADRADESVALTLTGSGADYGGTSASVTVATTDNDGSSHPITLSAAGLTVTEGGAAGSVTVRLKDQPSEDVTVTVGDSFTGLDLTVTPAFPNNTLTFTSATYATAQTVTVAGLHDTDAADDALPLQFTASGGLTATTDLRVVVDDDETATVSAPASLALDEGDVSSLTLRFSPRPRYGAFTVTVTNSNPKAVTVDADPAAAGAQSSVFILNTTNAVTLSVTAPQDVDADSATATLTWRIAGGRFYGAGGEYDGKTGTVSVAVTDDDTRGLSWSSADGSVTAVSVTEGATQQVSAALASRPTANVTVTFASSDTGAMVVDTSPGTSGMQKTLTFTTTNWNVAQAIDVITVADEDTTDEAPNVTWTAAGGDYAGVTGSLAVSIADDDLMTNTLDLAAADDSGVSASDDITPEHQRPDHPRQAEQCAARRRHGAALRRRHGHQRRLHQRVHRPATARLEPGYRPGRRQPHHHRPRRGRPERGRPRPPRG